MSPEPARPSRRALLTTGVPVTALGAAALATAPAPADPPGGDSPGADPSAATPRDGGRALGLTTTDTGVVTVTADDGTQLIRLAGYQVAAGIEAREGTVEADDEQDGSHVIRVAYEFSDPDYAGTVTVTAADEEVTAQWELTGPSGADLSQGRIFRTLIGADLPEAVETAEETYFPATQWTTDERGGVPYRERTHGIYFVSWNDGAIKAAIVIPESEVAKRGASSLHVPPTVGEDGVARATVTLRADSLVPDAWDRFLANTHMVAGAVLTEPAFTVDLSHPRTYPIYDEAGPQTLTLHAYAASGGRARLELRAYDYDGATVHRSRHTLDLEPGQIGTADVDVEFPGPRSYVFLEVTGRSGSARALLRTGAAVLPPHEFGPSDQSIVGMGGFSRNRVAGASQAVGIEPKADEIALWQRMGVRHLRNNWLTADESTGLDMTTAYQPAASPGQFADDPEGFRAWLDTAFQRAGDAGAVQFELLNEWNLRGGVYGGQYAEEYTMDWLLPFRDELDARGEGQKLISLGLGSWDPVFMDGVREHHGWDALDGVALHPGRGNFTADYDPVEITDLGSYGNVWNYHGSIRMARAYLNEHGGEKELWLTEVNAMTAPNRWWNDDERVATDSALLVLALGKAVGLTGFNWFELYDGTWNDKYGVSATDPEFHFGLMRADRSPKPSWLAFVTMAELIDGATFLGWVESDHPDLRGLRFTNADGPFWVLWSRQDGYVNWADHDDPGDDGDLFHAFPDPWDAPRGRHALDVRMPADRGTLTATDPLGRAIELPIRSDSYRVELTGSPVILRGAIAPDETRLDDVRGHESVKLHDVAVRRVPGGVGVTGSNASGGRLTLRIETALAHPQEVEVGKGDFDVSVEGAVSTGSQIRVFAEMSKNGQIHRADYYRSV